MSFFFLRQEDSIEVKQKDMSRNILCIHYILAQKPNKNIDLFICFISDAFYPIILAKLLVMQTTGTIFAYCHVLLLHKVVLTS